jgi:hypothetical protein
VIEQNVGKTPNGGVRSKALFQDDGGNAVDKASATRVEILEYDAEGGVIARTYMVKQTKVSRGKKQ